MAAAADNQIVAVVGANNRTAVAVGADNRIAAEAANNRFAAAYYHIRQVFRPYCRACCCAGIDSEVYMADCFDRSLFA